MSRIGRQPIPVPTGVNIAIDPGRIMVNGPLGELTQQIPVRMTIERQDDNTQLMAQLTALAKGVHDGQAQPTAGVHFVGIMGDGSGAFLAALNQQLEESFGPDYRAEIVGSCGYSRGEDKLMGPQRWRANPQSMRGALVAGVLRDGDWNIAQRFMGDNNLPNNPDETTYDPEAVNWVNTSSYVEAAEKYVAGWFSACIKPPSTP